MNPDLRRWRRSYKYLPFGAGEGDIAKASTSDLEAAHRHMKPCKDKPPGYEFQLSREEISPLLSEGSLFPYFERLIIDEGLRYARVCRELAVRTESDRPERALGLLRSALLPGSSAHAFENHDAYMSWWDRNSQHADALGHELLKLAGEVQDLSGDASNDGQRTDLVFRFVTGVLQYAIYNGLLQAGYASSEKQDAWNFWIKAYMSALEERLGHSEEASKLKHECLDILSTSADDGLWSSLIDGAIERSVIVAPVTAPAASPVAEEVETALARVLDTKLEPLLRSVGDNLRMSHALHDRLDLIVDKLIDLSQRSELTWQQVRKLARHEPDYKEVRRGIQASLAGLLGDTWRQLKPDSQKDLVDAEYVFEHCTRWGTGWRMAVLGYCTTAERELKATYKAARHQLVAVPNQEAGPIGTLGELIQALEKLATWLPKSKPLPALEALLNSADAVRRLNSVRKRAAHATDQEVSRDEAAWVRKALLSKQPAPLLTTIVAVRSGL